MDAGKRFSLLYLDRSIPLRDSPRFRNRLAAYFSQNIDPNVYYRKSIVEAIHLELGVQVPFSFHSYSVPDFLRESVLRDLLDSITVIYQFLESVGRAGIAPKWKEFVSNALEEENMGYRLDDKCGVHFFVDQEFQQNRYSTLKALEDPKYVAVKSPFDAAYKYLDSKPIDTKSAVRSIFESIEIIVKRMTECPRLNKACVVGKLKNKCLPIYSNDDIGKKVMSNMFDGFGQWVDAIHYYRHGQDNPEPVLPPLDISIYVLSSGAAFLRWLIELNNILEGKT